MRQFKKDDVPIFFYDAECGICDRTVAFLLEHAPAEKLRFAPLQSEIGMAILADEGIVDPEMRAAYFYDSSGAVAKSGAVLSGLACCRSPYSMLAIFRVIPRSIRDFFYDLVARNRYRLSYFSKPRCRVLSTEERSRFLGLG